MLLLLRYNVAYLIIYIIAHQFVLCLLLALVQR